MWIKAVVVYFSARCQDFPGRMYELREILDKTVSWKEMEDVVDGLSN
jgi:hypothetical protein